MRIITAEALKAAQIAMFRDPSHAGHLHEETVQTSRGPAKRWVSTPDNLPGWKKDPNDKRTFELDDLISLHKRARAIPRNHLYQWALAKWGHDPDVRTAYREAMHEQGEEGPAHRHLRLMWAKATLHEATKAMAPEAFAERVEALKAKAKGDTATLDLFDFLAKQPEKPAAVAPVTPAAQEQVAAAEPATGASDRKALADELYRLQSKVAVPDKVFMPAGWNPMAHRQKHAADFARIDHIEEALGQKVWQRTPQQARSAMGMPETKHREAVVRALKDGKTVPAHVLAEHPGVEAEAKGHAPHPTPPAHVPHADDPTHGGALHPEKRIDKHGQEQTRWVSAPAFDPQVHLAQHADDVGRMKWHQVADAFEAVDDVGHVHPLADHILRHRPDLEDDVVQASSEAVERLAQGVDLGPVEAEGEPEPEPEGPQAAERPAAEDVAPPLTPEPEPAETPRPRREPAVRAPDPDKIEPVGEHVARARRDVAQERLQNRDIASMTEAERVKYVTRDNMVPEVTAEQAEAMGKTPGWFVLRQAVINAIGPSFEGGDAVAQKFGYSSAAAEYARMVDHVCKTLDRCTTASDIEDAIEEMSEQAHGKVRIGTFDKYEDAVRASSVAFRDAGLAGDMSINSAYARGRTIYTAHGPTPERDMKRRNFPVATLGPKFIAFMHPSDRRRGPAWNGGLTRAQKADKLGWDGLRAARAAKPKSADTGPEERQHKWRTDVSETVKRAGGRNVERADPAQFARDFGLTEVDFGNYANQSDRAYHVQRAHEAFFDLAEVLGIDPQHVSLGGIAKRSSDRTQPLAIAFGARGTGRAAAHYEPGSVDVKGRPAPVINITKFNGGGSLAHEWGHFLDNMMARAHKPADAPYRIDRFLSHGDSGTLPGPVADAASTLSRAIRGGNIRDRFGRPVPTEFFGHAAALDGGKAKGYWATPHEMFARAFESYVQDKLEDNGRRSSYLADGTRDLYDWGKNVKESVPDMGHPEVQATLAARNNARAKASEMRQSVWNGLVSKHYDAVAGKKTTLTPGQMREVSSRAHEEWKQHPQHAAWEKANAEASAAGRAHDEALAKHVTPAEPAQPYPQGEERKRINAAFDRFFETLRAHPEVYKAIREHLAAPVRLLRLGDALKALAPSVGPPPARNRQAHPFVGTIRVPGLPRIRVETRKGEIRRGTDPDGNEWSVVMPAHYGEFHGTRGADGDPVDAFVGPNIHAPHAYVFHMNRLGEGGYDECKVAVGFEHREAAERCLRDAYDRRGLFFSPPHKLTIPELAAWLAEPENKGRMVDGGREMAKAQIANAPGLQLDPVSHRWKRLAEALQADHHLSHLDATASDRDNAITINRIQVHPDHRGGGHARAAMQRITDFADEHGVTLALTPDPSFGSSKAKLTKWYGSHGFLPNKGRNKDFRFQQTMLREPSAKAADMVAKAAHIDRLHGGAADGKQPGDFDPQALAEGTRHEREHATDGGIAREIAMDHLAEDPDYYRKPEAVEGKGPVRLLSLAGGPARRVRVAVGTPGPAAEASPAPAPEVCKDPNCRNPAHGHPPEVAKAAPAAPPPSAHIPEHLRLD